MKQTASSPFLHLSSMQYKPVKFASQKTDEFLHQLRARVKHHFKESQISTYGNREMVIKTIIILMMYLVPYTLVISGWISNAWLLLLFWLTMGGFKAAIGMAIAHDANHGAYSSNNHVNNAIGFLLNMVGGFDANWKIQHNRLHHSYTNIDGHDEDIAPGPVLRLHPEQPWYKHHRTQHLYAWFVYSLMTLFWVTGKDFRQLRRYHKTGMLGKRPGRYQKLLWKLIGTKALYFAYMLVLPLLLSPAPWWLTILFFILMHLAAGLTLASIFQLAHVMPSSEFPMPDKDLRIESHWAVHQLETTTNFSQKSRIFSWFIGGLNFQIEHHLFPNICHIHYRQLSKIVAETAREYDLPYHVQGNFFQALGSHFRMLKMLGSQSFR